ncbi:myosin heavy chain, muscle-like [Myxocyprinus asiaticus]|uniref:myosin heavy chain, muscle-like n=1 Tax=Myxocyprinus asiaticus TaxID=70543 RepID=UPI0022216BE2|nr:myosin heavy chain, muscle-like [Myxocyprinus asiaticus]
MRAMSAIIFMAICALLVVIYQAVQQELNIRNLKKRIAVTTEQVKIKEDGIVAAKMKVDELSKTISPVSTQRDQLKRQKEDHKKQTADSEKELAACQAEKSKLDKQNEEAKEALVKIKEGQEEERRKAEEEIEGLKKQILGRDLKICQFVDMTIETARKLCAGS